MNIRDTRMQLGITQAEFAARYNIPFRTIQNWESGLRTPPEYVIQMLERCVNEDLMNRKTATLPKYSLEKIDLPKRRDYSSAISWLKAVKDFIKEDVVFALDEALMCQGNFAGHSDEFLVWVYGSDSLSKFNGIVVLGNKISQYQIQNKNGLMFTNFSRTIMDAFANEEILDMQGVIEAMSKYYYKNRCSFEGISVAPIYQDRFEQVANEAIEYYDD